LREVGRIDRILDLVKQIWLKYPDQRFNQLISNLSWNYADDNKKGAHFFGDVANVDLFYVEDDNFEEYLKDYLNKFENRENDFKLKERRK
jgi:hypothetical protein